MPSTSVEVSYALLLTQQPTMAVPVEVAIILAVLLSLHDVVDHAFADVIALPELERVALQDLFRNWNNTKDVDTSLPGWKWFDPTTSYEDPEYVDTCIENSWRGVFCYIDLNETESAKRSETDEFFDATVVGLEVSDAFIVGTLPKSLWNFRKLVFIILSGNPGLTGPIPPPPTPEKNNRWSLLKRLDLHGNNFTGKIPDVLFENSQFIEDLDLSNNLLDGTIPQSLALNTLLRTLNLSYNNLTGIVPSNISAYWTGLVLADFSSNKFNGSLPNLTSAQSPHTLNFSHNEFGGEINLSIFNPKAKETLATLDCSDNHLMGALPKLDGWSNLQLLNLSSNSFSAGPFPSWVSGLPNLQMLSLWNANLTGELDLAFLKSSKNLKILELENNNIIGTLNLDSLLNMSRNGPLPTLSLKHNQIQNVIFSSNDITSLPISLELQGNPYCSSEITSDIQRCLCEQNSCYNTDRSYNKGIIIGPVVGGSIGALMMVITTLLYWKNRRDKQYLLLAIHEKFAEYEMKPTLFAYSELQKATRDFHPDNKLGEGGFGAVYKGTFADGSVVAVKQLFINVKNNMDEFLNEVVLLTSVKHRNLVKLKGCCLHGDRRLLVYEFVDNYDLAKTLFEHRGNQVVTWPKRFNICLGVAEGLHYLHAGVNPKIIHRDIKANNVLLDSNFHPKIADFGLAMLFPNEDTHLTIVQVAGTKGYLAPEYATRGQVSDKVDVFSFGVLALEVISGRKNISLDVPPDQLYLIEWVWTLNEEGRLLELVDPTISLQSNEEIEMHRVITIALACVQTTAERRPTMAQVVRMLQGNIQIVEALKSGLNENVNYRALLEHRVPLDFNSSATILNPVEESQALYVGENSMPKICNTPRSSIELGAMKAR